VRATCSTGIVNRHLVLPGVKSAAPGVETASPKSTAFPAPAAIAPKPIPKDPTPVMTIRAGPGTSICFWEPADPPASATAGVETATAAPECIGMHEPRTSSSTRAEPTNASVPARVEIGTVNSAETAAPVAVPADASVESTAAFAIDGVEAAAALP